MGTYWHSAGTYTQCLVVTCNGKKSEKNMYIGIYVNYI